MEGTLGEDRDTGLTPTAAKEKAMIECMMLHKNVHLSCNFGAFLTLFIDR